MALLKGLKDRVDTLGSGCGGGAVEEVMAIQNERQRGARAED